MKNLQQFEIIIEKAKEDEQEALRIYIDARTLYVQEEQKLEELRGYKVEYEKGYIKQGQQGININQINNYLSFLGKIDQSVRHQLQVIEQKKVHVERLRKNWVDQRARLLALEKVAKKRQQQHLQKVLRQEQKQQDEFAQRRIKVEEVID